MTSTGAFATSVEATETGTLVWFAEDVNGGPVEGAEFEVTGTDGEVLTVVDNGAGDINVTAGSLVVQVPAGTYVINQVSTLDGLELSEETHTVQVTPEGQSPNAGVVFVNDFTDDGDEGDEGARGDEGAEDETLPGDEGDTGSESGTQDGARQPVEEDASDAVASDDEAAPTDEASSDNAERAPPAQDETEVDVEGSNFAPLQPGPEQTLLRVTKGGDRTLAGGVTPLAGATFYAVAATRSTPPAHDVNPGTFAATCITDATGTCEMIVPDLTGGTGQNINGYWVVEDVAAFTDGSGNAWQRLEAAAAGAGVSNPKINIPYRFFTGNVSGQGHVHNVPQNSGLYVNPASNNTTNTKLGTHWVDRRVNPPAPAKCGLSLALVYDLSSSMTADRVTQLRDAASVFVDYGALGGTPSTVDMFQFGSYAEKMTTDGAISLATQDGINAAQAQIATLQAPPTSQFTNWDHALRLVQADPSTYDMVIFITDGDPTRNGAPVDGDGGNVSTTRTIDLEQAVISANGVKAQGTRILPLGVAMTTNSYLNLQGISGDVLGEDYFNMDAFEELQAYLQEFASASCGGTLSVAKVVVDANGDVVDDPELRAGWTFEAHTPAGASLIDTDETRVDTLQRTTTTSGGVNFPLEFANEDGTVAASRTVNVTELGRPGFEFVTATCQGTDGPVEIDGTTFTIEVGQGEIVSCEATNRLHPTVSLQKEWVDALAGDTAGLTINGEPTDPAVVSTATGAPGSVVDTTNVVTVPIAPGDPVVVAEVLEGLGNYATDLSCTGVDDIDYTGGELSGSFTMPSANVLCTFTNSLELADLTVAKSADTSYDRAYTWSILKEADPLSVNVAVGEPVTVDYEVTVTAETQTDSNIEVTGTIDVTNPNPVAFTVDLSDVFDGTACAIDGGGTDRTVAGDDTTSFPYTCEPGTTDDGVNTATVTWDASAHPGTTGEAIGTAAVTFGDPVNETDRHVTVTDEFDGGAPVLLPLPGDADSLDWVELGAGGTVTLEYTETIEAEPGTCTTYPNVATVLGDDAAALDEDEAEVEVCVGMDLEVEKNVLLSLERTHTYDLDKDVDQTRLNVDPETGEATFEYTVTVTDGAATDSDWVMSGVITVTNPNDWDVDAVVADVASVGFDQACTVTDPEATIPGNGSADFDYTCAFTEQPAYEGINTATVTWDEEEYFSPGGSANYVAEFDEDDWDLSLNNATVTIVDDKTDQANPVVIGEHTWSGEGNQSEYSYELTLLGVPGECVVFTNIAWLEELPGIGDDQAVTVCWPLDLSIEKTVNADFDREYFWTLDKEVDQTQVTIGEDQTAEFNYVVSATPDGFLDSAWAMSGVITVSNPNAEDVTVSVTDVPDVGGGATCTVADPTLVVPANGQAATAYECSFTSQPTYTGGTNTATASWTHVNGEPQSVSDTQDVTFDLDGETNLVVDVIDDMTDQANPVNLGQATWNADGVPTVFEYSLELEGVDGECVDYLNTAIIDQTGDEADQTVTVCTELGPEVAKTAQASFDREYFWLLDKDVDQTEVTITDGGTAEFACVVTATPDGFEDSGWTMTGQITVTNPNAFEDGALTLAVTDIPDVGGVCTVDGGEAVVLQPGDTLVLDYTCTFDEQPAYVGTNTAAVDWSGVGGETGTTSAEAPITFELDGETNVDVEVYDDMVTLESPGELLGTANWHDGPTEFEYDLELEGVAGECVDYINTAVIEQTGDEAEQTVTVCTELGPEVAKSAQASFDREYFWLLDKDVDETSVEIVGTDATFSYTVTTAPDGFEDSNWVMSGEITVTNPNEFEDGFLTVTVTDITDVGGECTVVGGEDAVLEPGETRVFDYECTFEEQPEYEGTNTAYVDWVDTAGDEQTETAEADVVFELDGETHLEVEVYDDQVTGEAPGELLGTANWHDGATEFTYELTLPGVAGECVTHTNTAVIPATGDEATADVTICAEDELVITKTAHADFDREYFWTLTKDVDRTEAIVEDGALAEFLYLVSATPDGFENSGWQMSGQITVTNPNSYEEGVVTVTVADAADVGGGCAVADGEDVVLEPGETRVFDYECSFEEQPEYEGTNTATVTWTGPDGAERSSTVEVPVVFELDEETNQEVHVYDDKVTLESPGELLGTAVWNAEGTPTEFSYSLSFGGTVGEWTYYTNTAVIEETGDTDEETVRVMVPKPPVKPEPPVKPKPPVIPTGDPVGGINGGLLAAGVAAMLLALLGAGVALVRRRENG